MKRRKIIGIFFVVLMVILLINIKSYAVTPTLEQIASAFNNCDTVKNKWSYSNNSVKATATDNKLIITNTTDEGIKQFEYKLNNNVLSIVLNKDDIIGGMVTNYLVDSIGQLYGYKDGELFATLNSEKILDYKLLNEGFEIIENFEGNISIEIDITKKIPLINFDDVYIEISDLEDRKQFISGKGSCAMNKGNIFYVCSDDDDENKIIVLGEKNELSINAYKSLDSILSVMFNNENKINLFKNNYSSFSLGDKNFDGFKIEVNPTDISYSDFSVYNLNSEYKFARITIDKSLFNKAITENNEEDKNNSNNIKNESNNLEKEL